ncbi:unnamed protein product [Moneuplotes crassus]|uniref:Uncharacterized protein n=1 Tax=Euplotes crassus TaxID=5936 RepID=A0AAD1XZU1_EUPCR|nr:unnamed protein product [Moneuplotes crassus]
MNERFECLREQIFAEVRSMTQGIQMRVDTINDKTRKSVLLSELIEQSQFDIEEGNLLKTLIRLCNQTFEKTISSIQIELDDHRIRLDDSAKNQEKKIDGVLSDYERLENKIKDQEWATKLHSEVLSSKAETASVKKIENMLHYYCEMEKFKDFECSVYKEFSALKDEMVQHNRDTSQEMAYFAKKFEDSLFEKQRDIITSVNKRLESFTELKTYHEQVGAIKAEIEVILAKIQLASEDLKEIKTISDSIDCKLKDKVENNDFVEKIDEIQKQFQKYALYSEIKRVELKIDPIIDDINKKLEYYESDNKMNKHIISRFDEVLTSKASKFSIDQIYLNFAEYMSNESFKKFEQSLKNDTQTTHKKINDMESDLESMKDYLREEVKKSMRRALGNLNSHIINLAGGRPINDIEFEACLRLKADKEETDKLDYNKANKEEMTSTLEKIKKLETQLKDATVLFMECVKDNIFLQNENKHKVINRNASLFQQLKTIHKWINQDEKTHPKIIVQRKQGREKSMVLPETASKLLRRKRKRNLVLKSPDPIRPARILPSTYEESSTMETKVSLKNSSRNLDKYRKYRICSPPKDGFCNPNSMPIEIQKLSLLRTLEKKSRTFSPMHVSDKKLFLDGPGSATHPKKFGRIIIKNKKAPPNSSLDEF